MTNYKKNNISGKEISDLIESIAFSDHILFSENNCIRYEIPKIGKVTIVDNIADIGVYDMNGQPIHFIIDKLYSKHNNEYYGNFGHDHTDKYLHHIGIMLESLSKFDGEFETRFDYKVNLFNFMKIIFRYYKKNVEQFKSCKRAIIGKDIAAFSFNYYKDEFVEDLIISEYAGKFSYCNSIKISNGMIICWGGIKQFTPKQMLGISLAINEEMI